MINDCEFKTESCLSAWCITSDQTVDMANGTAAAERKKGRMRLILNKFYGNSEADVENFKPNYDLDVFFIFRTR